MSDKLRNNVGSMAESLQAYPTDSLPAPAYTLDALYQGARQDLELVLCREQVPPVSFNDFHFVQRSVSPTIEQMGIGELLKRTCDEVIWSAGKHKWGRSLGEGFYYDVLLGWLNTRDVLSRFIAIDQNDVLLKPFPSEGRHDRYYYHEGHKVAVGTVFITLGYASHGVLKPSDIDMHAPPHYPRDAYEEVAFLMNYGIVHALNRMNWDEFSPEDISASLGYMLDTAFLLLQIFDEWYLGIPKEGEAAIFRELESLASNIVKHADMDLLEKELIPILEQGNDYSPNYKRHGKEFIKELVESGELEDDFMRVVRAIESIPVSIVSKVNDADKSAGNGKSRRRARMR